MQTLTETLIDRALNNRVLTDIQLGHILTGSDQRRYHLVNRALKAGELVRLRRGLYVLADRFRDRRIHPYALAQAFVPGSYVSFESALAYHGWIPEAVFSTACATPGRKTLQYSHPRFGQFSFHPLAIREGYFLEQVLREVQEEQVFLLAKPLRALMDLVCQRKLTWTGMDWLTGSLRIEYQSLRQVTGAEIHSLRQVYKHKQVIHFLDALGRELGHD